MDNLPARPGKELTLHDLLNIMDRRDDSDVWEQFKDDEPFDLAELTRDKIDGYYEVIKALEDDSKRLKARADEFKDMAAIQARKAERIENKLRYTMRLHESQRLPGHDFNAVTGFRKHLTVKRADVDMDLFMRFGPFVSISLEWADKPTWADAEAMPDRVARKFSWDKDALRKAFKDGTAPEGLESYVTYVDLETFKWEVRKK